MTGQSLLTQLIDGLLREEKRSLQLLHMVPSENVLSPTARSVYSGTLQARYSFGNGQFNPSWPAMDWFEQVERDSEEELASLLGASHVCLRSLSGMNAMAVALGASGAKHVMTVEVSDGGHAVTSQMVQKLGASVHSVSLDPAHGEIDVAATLQTVERLAGPVLIYLDQYCTVRPVRIAELAARIPPSIAIHYDASHIMGLVVGGAVANPLLDGAHSIGGSLHKSFPGPHRGLLASRDSATHEAFSAESTRWISHHQPGHTLALAITLAEMRGSWQRYARSVVKNAKAFAEALWEHNIPVHGAEFGFTECHQVFIDVSDLIDPEHASRRLIDAGIRMNAIYIPQLGRVGLRAGLQELTRRGLNESGARSIADIAASALTGDINLATLRLRSISLAEQLTWNQLSTHTEVSHG